jgi:ABC-type nitrate/sulfonate/bicarbonate transport system permease component
MAAVETGARIPLPRERAPAWRGFVRRRAPGVAALFALILIWYVAVAILDPSPVLFPGPGAVATEFVEVWRGGLLLPALSDSMQALAVGLIAALVVGILLGIPFGASPVLDAISSPYLWGFFATPRIALAPLVVLWFGFGFETKVWLVFLSAVIPIILSCQEGVKTVDESLVRAARAFGARRRDLFAKVVAPYTLPFIASGIRNGISRGFVGLLVVEMTVGSGGIGTQVMRSMRRFDSARMFALVIVLVVVALALISLSRRLEQYASRWREEVSL